MVSYKKLFMIVIPGYRQMLNKLIAFLLFSSVFVSCNKEADLVPQPADTVELPDLSSKVPSSVYGFVVNENGQPVAGATVQFGTATQSTSASGLFSFDSIDVVKTAAVVTVKQPGYFTAVKTFAVKNGQKAFFRIRMLPKAIAGSVNSSSGGSVALPNGFQVSLPANAVVLAAGGAAYTGQVSVSAQWLDPSAPDLLDIMPGDLRGIDTSGAMSNLITYGMVAVELTGSGGELLQVAPGKKSTLNIPLPAAFVSSAPASIPLWYFDEAKGLWVEEGRALKNGSSYTGEVSHFSFWNLDVPTKMVSFNLTVVGANQAPVSQATVRITSASNPVISRSGYTNDQGYVSGFIPENEQWVLDIFPNSQCTNSAYTQPFATTNVNLSLGTIAIGNNNPLMVSLQGNVVNCLGALVSRGRVMIQYGSEHFLVPVNTAGSFSHSILTCSPVPQQVVVVAEDMVGLQQGIPAIYPIVTGQNNLGTLSACGSSTQQFIYFTTNGTMFNLVYPADSISLGGSTGASSITVQGWRLPNFSEIVAFNFTRANIAVGSVQQLNNINSHVLAPQNTMLTPVNVNITEYGAVNEFISGYFSGTITGNPGNISQQVTCQFRVRRTN